MSHPADENLGVPFFADHIRALTESFDSKLADAGNPLVRQLGRYLTVGWPKSPKAQANRGDGQQTGRGRPWNGHQVDQTNRSQQSSVRRFSATPTEVLPWFSSVARRMPGYNFMQRRGTARIPPQAQRPHQSACTQSRIRNCDSATLGSNHRKPSNQSMPSHILVVNKVKPPLFPSVVLNYDVKPLA
jgi:hypothetical protein